MEDYLQLDVIIEQTLHKKRSFRLRISSVDVTKPTITANLVKSLMQNVIFCVVRIIKWQDSFEIISPQRGNNGQDIN